MLLASFRGRKPKKHRLARAKELKKYLDEAKQVFKGHLSDPEIEKYYKHLVEGKVVKLSKFERLGIENIVSEKILYIFLLLARLFKPAPLVIINCNDASYRKKVYSKLTETLRKSKMNVKNVEITSHSQIANPSIFLKRITSDVVIIDSTVIFKGNHVICKVDSKEGIENSIIKIISKLSASY